MMIFKTSLTSTIAWVISSSVHRLFFLLLKSRPYVNVDFSVETNAMLSNTEIENEVTTASTTVTVPEDRDKDEDEVREQAPSTFREAIRAYLHYECFNSMQRTTNLRSEINSWQR